MTVYYTSNISSDPTVRHIPKFGGELWYVNGTTGSDLNEGMKPDGAFATIGAAISACSAGDAITIMQGTYTEVGLDLNKTGVELWFEIGAVLDPASGTALTVSGNYCRVTCEGGALKVTPAQDATGVLVSGNFCYLNEIRVDCNGGAVGTSADIGFDITGDGCDLRRCRCASPDIAAFKVQGDKVNLESCCTGGNAGYSSIGYWITNSCDKFRIKDCGSQGHETAPFQVDTGCTNGVIESFSSGGGDGKWIDADNATVISNLTYPETKYATAYLDGSTSYRLFKVTGSIKLFNIFGHVTTVIANTSSTINLELYSTNASIDITASGGAPNIQADVVGTVYAKESVTTDPLEKGEPTSTPAIIENTNYRDPKNPILLIEDDSADTYVDLVLSDAVATGVIHWHIEWEPITDDGFIEPV